MLGSVFETGSWHFADEIEKKSIVINLEIKYLVSLFNARRLFKYMDVFNKVFKRKFLLDSFHCNNVSNKQTTGDIKQES